MPYMVRGTYPRELRSWTLLAVALGGVEGGITGVIVKNAFAGAVDPVLLNFAVALVAGAPALSHVLSWVWAGVSQGCDKIRFLIIVQSLCCLSLLLIAAAPINSPGLALMVGGAILARFFWSGVTTIRSSVWRANYPREMLASMSGRLITMGALLMGGVGIGVGIAMDWHGEAFRYVYPVLALVGLTGAYSYRRMRMRHQKRLLAAEAGNLRREGSMSNPFRLFKLLRRDDTFRRYMSLMFLLGGGNLMLMAPLIVILNEHMDLSQLQQIIITSSIPLLVMPFAIPIWARMLDTRHVIHYRAKQSWAATVMIIAVLIAVTTQWHAMLWVAAVLYGVSQAGGMLGWNIGHHDFAPPERAAQYMSVHMTLTGMRGLFMPLAGVALYQLVEMASPGNGPWMMVVPLALNIAACFGFLNASRRMRREEAAAK
ncbi:MAG: MFS transporter [Gammaproteobacteria bacterium]